MVIAVGGGGATGTDDQQSESQPENSLSLMDRFVKRLGVIGGFYSQNQLAMRAARNAYITCMHIAQHEQLCAIMDAQVSVQLMHI